MKQRKMNILNTLILIYLLTKYQKLLKNIINMIQKIQQLMKKNLILKNLLIQLFSMNIMKNIII